MATTPYPLGVFVGSPYIADIADEALFNSDFQSFVTTMNVTPTYSDAYIDQSQPVDQWITNASWSAQQYAGTAFTKNITPIIGLPLDSTAPGSETPDEFYKDFASGKYDSVIEGVVKAWAAQGYTTQQWRVGWEMNLTSSSQFAGSDAATQADWVAAFQHVSTVLHQDGTADGVNVKVVYNPGTTNYTTASAAALYPGNQYVDIIGADVYSDAYPYGNTNAIYNWALSGQVLNSSNPVYSTLQQWASNPINLTHYYTDPASTQYSLDGSNGNSLSLQDIINLAQTEGKPLAIEETGAGSTDDGAGVSDNPTFVDWLSNTLANAGVPIANVNIWDSTAAGNYEFSLPSDDRPAEAAAWAADFGAQATPATVVTPVATVTVSSPVTVTAPVSVPDSVVVGSGSDTIDLKIAEDAFNGDAQFTISVDGVQVGATQTAQASQSAGATQDFQVEGNWATGANTVSVDFLNDLYQSGVGDRNLYVDVTSVNGTVQSAGTLNLYSTGSQSLTVQVPVPVPNSVVVGSGPDTIDLKMAEDAFQGDAQFTVSVDGVQVGGKQTAQASQSAKATQDFQVEGNWAAGSHTVTVDFLNDLYQSGVGDRNLYVDGATYEGVAQPNSSLTLMGAGTQSLTVQAPVAAPDTGDFDGNGASDILFQKTDGSIDTWLMSDASVTSSAVVSNPGTSWHAMGTGDFNGDGKADILFQNDDGAVDVWLMNGQTINSGTVVANPGPSWHVVGTGDFNGDGTSDIVSQNNDGSVDIWEMDAATVLAATVIANPGPSWHVVGTGDLEGTGQTDLLLQNDYGSIESWQTNGTTLTSETVIADPGPSWHIVGTGDFNGDGKSDIVLQNNNGTVNVWEMNGSTITSSIEVADPGSSWHAIGVGDYNGDGKPDILFQNNNGTVETWLMNGTSVVSGNVVANPGTSWQAISQGSMHFIDGTQSTGTLAGTILNDDFVFTTSLSGSHVISGFDPIHDVITLDQMKFGSYGAVQAAETTANGSTVITLGTNDTLTINGVLPGALAAKNFV